MSESKQVFPTVPDFWQGRLEQIAAVADTLHQGRAEIIATSADGYDVWAWTFGPEPPSGATANFPSASCLGDLSASRGSEAARAPSLMLVTGVHGAETEGPVAAVNLANVLETGRDLRGVDRPELVELAEGMRIVIVPQANPDGRARVEPDSLVGMAEKDLRHWGQGTWPDGSHIGWPDCKRYQPLPLEETAFPGAYVNGGGYNLMYDIVPGDLRTDEARGLFRLATREMPDMLLNGHSCQMGGGIVPPRGYLPPELQREVFTFAGQLFSALQKANLRPHDFGRQIGPNLDLAVMLSAATGCTPAVFEGPHGLAENPFTHEEILETHMVLFSEAMKFTRRLKAPRG